MTDSGAVRRAGLLVLLLLLACAKQATRAEAQLPPDPKDELKAKVAELYEALEQLEPERLNALLTPEPLVYGLGPKQTFTNRDTLVESLRAELVPFGLRGDAFKVSGAAPRVGLAPGGGSGWFYDFPRFEQQRSGKAPKQWNVRITGHAVHDDARWRFDAVHVSFGFPDTQLYAPDANKKLKAPEPAGQLKTADCEPLLSLNKRMLDDIAVKVERTSDADEVVLIGTDPTDVFEGGAKFKALARPKLPELKRAAFSLRLEDGPRARLANDGKSAWVSGSVVLRLGRVGKQQTLPAFRALWIFALENDGWRLVSEHQSLGLPDELRVPVGG